MYASGIFWPYVICKQENRFNIKKNNHPIIGRVRKHAPQTTLILILSQQTQTL
jgi:hypothetical protein